LLSSVTCAYVGITVTYFEHGRGGKTFDVGAFTEVVAGDDILAHVEVRVVVRRETGGVAGLQPPPLVLGRLAGAKASLVVDVACLAEGLVELDDGAKVVEASRMQMGVEREWERAGRDRQMFMPSNGWSEGRWHTGACPAS
jgi:hypothetical protein